MQSPRPSPPQSLSLNALLDLLGPAAHLEVGDGSTEVSGVSLATSGIEPGDLFAALGGARAHGAQFADQAIAAGATAVLTDPDGARRIAEAGLDVPTIVVADPRARLGEVSAAIYRTGDRDLHLFGITGTNGKTTTAYILASALGALGRSTGLIGTVETRIGSDRVPSARTTPEATDLHALLAVMAERGLDDCVMEVSSHALALHRVDEVIYDIAMFTNLSQDHLDFHETMENYLAAKADLFTPRRSRRGVVCIDDEGGREVAARASVPVVTLASQPGQGADWWMERGAEGFVLRGPDGLELALRSALPGDFNEVNTALAAVALILAGHDPQRVRVALEVTPEVPGRMQPVVGPTGSPRGVVDFAHTPDAVAAALAALRESTPGTLVAVLGAGGSRDPGKRPGMGAAAARHADVVIVTDDNPRDEDPAAIREAVAVGAREIAGSRPVEVKIVPGRAEAIAHAVAAAGGDGTVALLGKGHETGQEITGTVHPFDDREVLAAALREETR
ncbi:UDP-N-acetylmuramoyl-L-alanyl-D-glutamate--2,6-diaminopimelate ligase [Janibacter sp. GXQ6167]|uniref:UDP-N-acetylmuramoyl-L-alanyl-D-glutamate--2, 6-diaminopimelate ligase n=1 Tax=Janibacter sp. GXQ6167 TaxID=3240791 RepID=UPI0035249679